MLFNAVGIQEVRWLESRSEKVAVIQAAPSAAPRVLEGLPCATRAFRHDGTRCKGLTRRASLFDSFQVEYVREVAADGIVSSGQEQSEGYSAIAAKFDKNPYIIHGGGTRACAA
jgi:hypothetical protein